MEDMEKMRIDCGTCLVRGAGCADCVVSLLLGPAEFGFDGGASPPMAPEVAADVPLAKDEVVALRVLAGAELVPPLRWIAA
ncbi:MAG: hypothetical protein LBR20_08020 [Propionibacteriaceae bacterium]|jgi:hypothetical protein|nr:hypothetical protein [Propionibacteriaceae bacterium]